MQTKRIQTSLGECTLTVGVGALLSRLSVLKAGRTCFVITDRTVFSTHGEIFKSYFKDTPLFLLPQGEKGKTEKSLFKILKRMADVGLKRDCLVFVVGGGAVGDVGAMAAALYMRGVELVQIPTTLLAQVDAAIGGKAAIDLGKLKNMAGCFYPAKEVIVDPLFLRTLPPREIKCGLGEIVKYAALSPTVYSMLDAMEPAALSSIDFLSGLVAECAFLKAEIVEADERDEGERRCLNLGHTTAHALELFYSLSHGESVLFGLLTETEIAARLGVCDRAFADKFESLLLTSLAVSPIKVPDFKNVGKALTLALADKKNVSDGQVRLSVPTNLGEWTILPLDFKDYLSETENILSEIFEQ